MYVDCVWHEEKAQLASWWTTPLLHIVASMPNVPLFPVAGFIDFLLSTHPIAKTLRDNVVFKIVPMLNPDGVFLGNYR